MANQTLQKDEKKGSKNHTAARLIFPDACTPGKYTVSHARRLAEQCLKVDITILGIDTEGVEGQVEYVYQRPTKELKKKIKGFTDKIDPFGDKPYVTPKAIQDKIEDIRQLLKGSPIPEEFLK